MRFACILIICVFVSACQTRKQDVWERYEWLPPGAENSNPYVIPQNAYQGYGNYPVYDNDSDYVQPYGWGMCNGTNNLGNCE